MPGEFSRSTDFEEYRVYLQFLARTALTSSVQNRIDPSDIVQQSMLKAIEARKQFRGATREQEMAWLRKILIRTARHATRDQHALKRDVKRELSIEQSIEQSSMKLKELLPASDDSPSREAVRNEQGLVLAAAIEQLPADQRMSIILKYWHGYTLEQIANELGKSIPAVAGLLHRATKKLRKGLCFDIEFTSLRRLLPVLQAISGCLPAMSGTRLALCRVRFLAKNVHFVAGTRL